MSEKTVASLSAGSYVNSPELMASITMANMLTSEISQSNMFQQSITSIPAIIQAHNNNLPAAISALRSGIENCLSRVFDSAVVEVEDPLPISDPTPRRHLRIRVSIINGGRQYSLERLLRATKGDFAYVNAINNEGLEAAQAYRI